MKFFITGGTGFIGSHIVVELLSNGDEVTILARNPGKIPKFLETPGISIVEGGLGDLETLRAALPGHDACIHNALLWEEAPTELELKDTRAAVNVFEVASEAGIGHLVYTSSTAVHRPFTPHMNEGMRLTPSDLYGATKAAAEMFLFAFSHQTGMRCNVIRPGPTIGTPAVEGAPVRCDSRFEAIVQAALRGEAIRVAKHDGRQFIGAQDLAKTYAAVLHSGQNREAYIGVGRDFTTWERIALDVVAMAGSRSHVFAEDEGLSEDPPLFDTGKVERELGLTFDSRDAMRDHLRRLIARGPEP